MRNCYKYVKRFSFESLPLAPLEIYYPAYVWVSVPVCMWELRKCGFCGGPSKSHKIIICKREFISKNIYGWLRVSFCCRTTRASMEFSLFASLCRCLCACVSCVQSTSVCVRSASVWVRKCCFIRASGNNWRTTRTLFPHINLIRKPLFRPGPAFNSLYLDQFRFRIRIGIGIGILHFYFMEIYAKTLRQLMGRKSLIRLMESWLLSGRNWQRYMADGWLAVKRKGQEDRLNFSFKLRHRQSSHFSLHTLGRLGKLREIGEKMFYKKASKMAKWWGKFMLIHCAR